MLAVAAAAFWYRFLTFTQFANDHFVHVALGQQMARGAWPVRDFVDRGAPLMSLVAAAGQVVLGEGLRSELVVTCLALAIAAALCVYVAARLSGSLVTGIALAIAVTLIYPFSYSYPKLLLYAATFAAAWWYFAAPASGRSWLAAVRPLVLGASIAVAFLFRHDHGIFLALGTAAAFAAWRGVSVVGVLRLASVAGVALVLTAPYFYWIHRHEGLGTYVGDGLEFSRRESERSTWALPGFAIDDSKPLWTRLQRGPVVNVRWDPAIGDEDVRRAERRHGLTRHDPAGPRSWQYALSRWSPSALEALVTDPAAADTHGIDRSRFVLQVPAPEGPRAWLVRVYGPGDGLRLRDNAIAALYYAAWLLPIAALVVVWRGWGRIEPEIRALVVMAAVVHLLMDVTMLREPLGNRVRDVIVPLAALVAFLAAAAWRVTSSWVVKIPLRAAAVAPVAAIIVLTGSIGEAVPRMAELTGDGAGIRRTAKAVNFRLSPPQHRTGSELSQGYLDLVESVRQCTPETSRLLGLGFVPELYVYTGRGFAGGHVMFIPGYYLGDRHASLMLGRLRQERVPLVIVDEQIRQEIVDAYPRLWAHVATNYREARSFEIRPGRTFVMFADAPTFACVRGQSG